MTCVLHKAYFSRNCGFSFIIIVFLQFFLKEPSEKNEVWEFRILKDLGAERTRIGRPGLSRPDPGRTGLGRPSSGIPGSTFKLRPPPCNHT